MRYVSSLAVAAVAAVAACGGGSDSPGVDAAPIDAAVDAGPCTGRELTGALVDWDSSNVNFRGVPGVQVAIESAPDRAMTTPPNGRITLCAPASGAVLLELDAPAQSPPAGTDYLDGLAHIDAGALAQTQLALNFRALSNQRKQSFYQERAITYDATRGHILIYQTAERTALSINKTSGPAVGGEEAANGSIAWGMDGGRYVLFPNVVADGGMVQISGPFDGPRTVKVAADRITFVMLHFTP